MRCVITCTSKGKGQPGGVKASSASAKSGTWSSCPNGVSIHPYDAGMGGGGGSSSSSSNEGLGGRMYTIATADGASKAPDSKSIGAHSSERAAKAYAWRDGMMIGSLGVSVAFDPARSIDACAFGLLIRVC